MPFPPPSWVVTHMLRTAAADSHSAKHASHLGSTEELAKASGRDIPLEIFTALWERLCTLVFGIPNPPLLLTL